MSSKRAEKIYRNPVPFAEFHFRLANRLVEWGIQPEKLCKLLDRDLRGTGAYSLHKSLQNNASKKTGDPVILNAYFINRWVYLRSSTWPDCDDLEKLFRHHNIQTEIRELCKMCIGHLKISRTKCCRGRLVRPELQISQTGKLFAFCPEHDLSNSLRRRRKGMCFYKEFVEDPHSSDTSESFTSPSADSDDSATDVFSEGDDDMETSESFNSECDSFDSDYTDSEGDDNMETSESFTSECDSSDSDYTDSEGDDDKEETTTLVIHVPISEHMHAALAAKQQSSIDGPPNSLLVRRGRCLCSESDDESHHQPGALRVKRPHIESDSDSETDGPSNTTSMEHPSLEADHSGARPAADEETPTNSATGDQEIIASQSRGSSSVELPLSSLDTNSRDKVTLVPSKQPQGHHQENKPPKPKDSSEVRDPNRILRGLLFSKDVTSFLF